MEQALSLPLPLSDCHSLLALSGLCLTPALISGGGGENIFSVEVRRSTLNPWTLLMTGTARGRKLWREPTALYVRRFNLNESARVRHTHTLFKKKKKYCVCLC